MKRGLRLGLLVIVWVGAATVSTLAGEPESVIQLKERSGRDPYNWTLYNELGMEYYKYRWYDEAITAFRQALAVHGMSRQIKAEQLQNAARKEEIAAQNKQAELVKRQQENAAAAQALGILIGGMGGMGGLGGMDGLAANMAMQTAGGAAQAALAMDAAGAVQRKDTGMLSDVQANRDIAGILFNLGRAQYARLSFSDAIQAFDEARKTDPALTVAAYWVAEANYQQGRFAKALEGLFTFTTVVNAPNRPVCLLRAANAYRGLEMAKEADRCFADAVQPYELALKADSKDAAALRNLGDLYAGRDDSARALDCYQRFLGLAPNDASVLLAAAAAAYNSGAFDLALGYLARLEQPTTPLQIVTYANYMKGLILLDTGKTDVAKAAFDRAVADNTLVPPPSHVVAAKALGGDQEEGLRWLNREVFDNPFSPSACPNMYRLGRVLQMRNEPAKALELYARCLAVQPGYGPAQRAAQGLEQQLAKPRATAEQQGDAQAGQKQFADAARAYADALRLTAAGPRWDALMTKLTTCVAALETPPPMTTEGMRHFLRGNAALKVENRMPADIARAISEYRWALVESPWAPVILKHLAVAYMLNGQYQAAGNGLKTFLATHPKPAEASDALEAFYRAEFLLETQRSALAALCPGQ
jgi:tetratricopeptide (TPR) repeat protein